MRNGGAAHKNIEAPRSIYGAMPESRMQVPSDIHCFKGVQGSGFRVQRGGAAHKNREAPRSFEIYGNYKR